MDQTALRCAEARARDEAHRLRALLDSVPATLFTYDHTGRCTSARGRGLAHLGLVEDELVGTGLLEASARVPVSGDAVAASLAGEHVRAVVGLAERVWECHYGPMPGASDEPAGGIGIALDITELTTAEREVRSNATRQRALLRHAADVVVVLARSGRLLYASPAVAVHFGYDDRSLFWQDARRFGHPHDRALVDSAWRCVLAARGSSQSFRSRVLHADGSWRWTEHVMTDLLDVPDVAGVVVNLRVVADGSRTVPEPARLTLHDALTGLSSRALLLDHVEQALARGRRHDRTVGLVLLDVRGMAEVNASVGDAGGDLALVEVAARLRATARETDTLARVGGGRFAVLIEDVTSLEELRSRAAVLADGAGGPVDVEGTPVVLALRAATALGPAPGAGALLAAAERALLGTGSGAGAGPVWSGEREAVLDLGRGIRDGELRMHLQPVVDLRSGAVAGAEALVRWQHPERGLLLPSAFIGLAERCGLITELGAWILREACTQAAAWEAAGLACSVGVNLSPLQMAGDAVVPLVQRVLHETGARPGRLVMEVTESALMDDPGAAAVLQTLRELGVRLALDDFGTGYSSLTYLKRFPIDALKVDRSFVAGLGRDRDDEAIVASVASLGRAVGKTVVAEGVETVAQLEVLRELGVDQGQGFLWSPGLPPDRFEQWRLARGPGEPLAPLGVARRRPPVTAAAAQDPTTRRILQLQARGASLHTIAAALNADGRRTGAGARWSTTTVARVIAALVSQGAPEASAILGPSTPD